MLPRDAFYRPEKIPAYPKGKSMWVSHQAHYSSLSWAVPGLGFFQAPGEEVARSKEGFLASLLFQSPIPWIYPSPCLYAPEAGAVTERLPTMQTKLWIHSHHPKLSALSAGADVQGHSLLCS